MLEQLRQTARQLLLDGKVDVVIGYGESAPGEPAHPVFVTSPEQVDQLVFNDRCFNNLTAYLTRKEIKALGRPAVVVKGCDAKALVVLAVESQIEPGSVYSIGVVCDGVGEPRLAKCQSCDVRVPRHTDVVIGEPAGAAAGEDPERRYADVAALMAMSPAERMAYWREEFARCVKCYACRQVCPLCYCERCLCDKNQPQVIRTSATLVGNLAWHINRAFHLAGRCIGCDECTRACPAGINLRLLNLLLAQSAEQQFGYRAGMDPQAEPVIGSYSTKDKECFIR